MILGFTGSRHGVTSWQLAALESFIQTRAELIDEAVHGGCVGADAVFHRLCLLAGLREKLLVLPSNIKLMQAQLDIRDCQVMAPVNPLTRNASIAAHATQLVACPHEAHEKLRSGTWATIRYARKNKTPVAIITPDGRTTYET